MNKKIKFLFLMLFFLPSQGWTLVLQVNKAGETREIVRIDYQEEGDGYFIADFAEQLTPLIPSFFAGQTVCLDKVKDQLYVYIPGKVPGVIFSLTSIQGQDTLNRSDNRSSWWPVWLIEAEPEPLSKKADPHSIFVLNPFSHAIANYIESSLKDQKPSPQLGVRAQFIAPNRAFADQPVLWDTRGLWAGFKLMNRTEYPKKTTMTRTQFASAIYQLEHLKIREYFGYRITIKPMTLETRHHQKCCGRICPDPQRAKETIAHFHPAFTKETLQELMHKAGVALQQQDFRFGLLNYGKAILHFKDRTALDSFQEILSTFIPLSPSDTPEIVLDWLGQPASKTMSNAEVLVKLWLGTEQEVRQLKKKLSSSTHPHINKIRIIYAHFLKTLERDNPSIVETANWLKQTDCVKEEL